MEETDPGLAEGADCPGAGGGALTWRTETHLKMVSSSSSSTQAALRFFFFQSTRGRRIGGWVFYRQRGVGAVRPGATQRGASKSSERSVLLLLLLLFLKVLLTFYSTKYYK